MTKVLVVIVFTVIGFAANAQTGTTIKSKKPTENHRSPASNSSSGLNGDNGIAQNDTTSTHKKTGLMKHRANKKRTGGATKMRVHKNRNVSKTDSTNRGL